MPRTAKPENAPKRLRTEKWREHQAELQRPEASHVDVAVAGAVAALLRQQEDRKDVSSDLSIIVRSAAAILASRGFDEKASNRKLLERLRSRRDLGFLQSALVPAKTVTTRPAND